MAGAYCRRGAGDSFRFANSRHKVAVLAALLHEIGCADVRTESTQGLIPATDTLRFRPTPELRAWLDRRW